MIVTSRFARASSAILICVIADASFAQDAWPSKPVRLVMPFSPGGPGDVNARIFAEGLRKILGQVMIVDNRPGAGGIIGADFVAKSAPDGYTFLLAGNGAITASLLHRKMPYADSDLVPVARSETTPSILVANAKSGLKSLKDLQAHAHKNKGITFADAGSGSTGHFVANMTQVALGIDVTIVHYKGGSDSVNAVVASHVDVASEATLAVLSHIRSGRLVALAVASDRRSATLPEVPTTAEQGFPSIQMQHWGGSYAPKGTRTAILDKMNAAINATSKLPEVRARFEAVSYESSPGTRADFESFIASERQRLQKIVVQQNMTAD
jgi:tripartite-type tricarboxylate transporter receptor subunit TctC